MKSAFLSHQRKGFTLIELIIVIAILAILAGISYPVYMAIAKNAERTAAEKSCTDIVEGVTRYSQDQNGALPYDGSMVKPDSDDQIRLITSEGRDARLVEVLTNREKDDDNRLNTSRDTYLRSDEKEEKRDGLYIDPVTDEINLFDPWGSPFYVILCEEQEGCIDPFTQKRYRGKNCFVFSLGADKEGLPESFSTGKKSGKKASSKKDKKSKKSKKEAKAAAAADQEALEEAMEDNVYSWKKAK